MDLKLTNAEIINLFNTLDTTDMRGGPKFTYVISKNRAILKPFVEAVQEAGQSYMKNSPRAQEYQKKVTEMVQKYSVDASGKSTSKQLEGGGTQFMISADKLEEFNVARELLDKEYNDVVVGLSAHQSDFNALLREEIIVPEVRTMKLSDLPKTDISTKFMHSIFLFVEDDDTTNKEQPKK